MKQNPTELLIFQQWFRKKTNFVTIDIRINNHYQYLNKGGNIKNYAASTYMSYDN